MPRAGPQTDALAHEYGTEARGHTLYGAMTSSLAARIAAFSVAVMILLVPAVWNGFPLLFYDSGAYLGRAFFDTLSPGRSALYGFFLGAGRFWNFWPIVLVQSAITVWVVALCLRAHDIGSRPYLLVGLTALLGISTSLPWLTGQLMPDLLAGLSVLAVYLLAFRADVLALWERLALFVLVAFSAGSHNATLAVLLLLLVAGAGVRLRWPQVVSLKALTRIAAALALGVALLLTANFAVTGRLAWTPGGTAFVFSRLVHDGIVHRFLEDNCPNPRYELCKHRAKLPHHANDFLWHQGEDGPFARIGGFYQGADEMREIALESLWQYPGLHLYTALRSTLQQLIAVGTGWGIVYDVWDAYGHIENLTPEAVPAAHSARQRHNELHFDTINLLHRPVAWLSMAALALFLVAAWRRAATRTGAGRHSADTRVGENPGSRAASVALGPRLGGNERTGSTPLVQLAATIGVALLANAVICGALSNPHDRYGARIVWVATLFVAIAVARMLPVRRPAPTAAETSVAAQAPTPMAASDIVPSEVAVRPPQRRSFE